MTVQLPAGMVWQERPFPNANFLLLCGEQPAVIDSGFVAHAAETQRLIGEHTASLALVVNTHWHSDHIGANQLLQAAGARIVGSRSDANALENASPHCCVAEYLDQPVPQYTVDIRVTDDEQLLLGDSDWQVLEVPGHTPGHLAFFNSEHRILAVGDTVSSYDVGWVNLMSEGTGAFDDAIASLRRLRELDATLLLPGHGPVVTHPVEAFDKAISRLQRQRADTAFAVLYGAKRVLSYAFMIRGGIPTGSLDAYLGERGWAQDAAALLGQSIEKFGRGLVDSMVDGGAAEIRGGSIYATTASTPVDASVFDLPFPRDWLA